MKYFIIISIAILGYIIVDKMNKQATISLLAEIKEFKLNENLTYEQLQSKVNEKKYQLFLSQKLRDYILFMQKIEFYLDGEISLEDSIVNDYKQLTNKRNSDIVANFNLHYYLFYFSLQSHKLEVDTEVILNLLCDLSKKINTDESIRVYKECENMYGKKVNYE